MRCSVIRSATFSALSSSVHVKSEEHITWDTGVAVGARPAALTVAGLLAALAGMVDVLGYRHLSGLFISFMSGNTTQLAAAIGQGNFAAAGAIAELITLFVLGATAGQILAGFAGRWHMSWVLLGVAGLLAVSAVLGSTPEPMVLAMGALNASMHRAGNIPISLSFVTGTLVRFGQGLGDFLTRRQTGWIWLQQASPWLGLITGGTIGAAIYVRIGEAAIWVPVIWAGLLAAWSASIPDPD
jgi:uncharacterized membrane protein YoaK (UPF0700 family)